MPSAFNALTGWWTFLLLIGSLPSIAQIPVNPNKSDNKGRQGVWTLLLSKNWTETKVRDSALYYRAISYKDDKPEGVVREYFVSTGKVFFEGKMLEDRPVGNQVAHYAVDGTNPDGTTKYGGICKIGRREVDGDFDFTWDVGGEATKGVGKVDLGTVMVNYGAASPAIYKILENGLKLEGTWGNGQGKENLALKPPSKSPFASASLGTYSIDSSNPNDFLTKRHNTLSDGIVTFFNEDGVKELEGTIQDNHWKGSVSYFSDDGKLISESSSSLTKMGVAALRQNDFKNALDYFKKGMVRSKYESGSESYAYGECMVMSAQSYMMGGQSEPAARWARRSITIFEHLDKNDNVSVATGIAESIIGVHLANLKQFSEAEPFLQRSLLISERIPGKGQAMYNKRLYDLAACMFNSEQYEKAKPLFTEARDQFKNSIGRDNETYLYCTFQLGAIYYYLKSYDQAKILFEELEGIISKNASLNKYYDGIINWIKKCDNPALTDEKKSAVEPAVLNANRLRLEGKNEAAIVILERVIKDREAAYGPKSLQVAEIMQELGLNYFDMGRYDKALGIFEKITTMYEVIEGKNSIHATVARSYQGMTLLWEGQIPKAEALLYKSYQDGLNFKQANPKEYDMILVNLGNYNVQLRNYEKAESLFGESLEIRKKIYGPNHLFVANLFHNLGLVYYYEGKLSKSAEAYQQALIIFKNSSGTKSTLYGMTQQNLSLTYQKMGKKEASSALLDSALVAKVGTLGPNHPEVAILLNNMGLRSLSNGQYKDGEVFLTMAEDMLRKSLGKKHPAYSNVLNNLANAKELQSKGNEAEKLYLETLDLTYQEIRTVFPALSETEKKKYYDGKDSFFQGFGNFVMNPEFKADVGKRAGYWYDMRLQTKGLLFHASVQMRERIASSGDGELKRLFSRWLSLRDSLTRAYQRPPAPSIARLEEEVGQMEKDLAKRSEAFRKATENRTYTWKDVQRELKPGEAAVEIIRLKKREINSKKDGFEFHPAYVALVIRYDTKDYPRVVVMNDGVSLEERNIRYYRNAIRFNVKDDSSYNFFWKPFASNLEGIKKVYFSPDGIYNLINPGTLINTDRSKSGVTIYLNDDIEVETVLSTKDLITHKAIAQKLNSADLFGYPNYNYQKTDKVDSSRSFAFNAIPSTREIKADLGQRFFSGSDIAELPGTKTEIENIRLILVQKSVRVNTFLFDNANEAAIKKINNPQVLHIATHGYFLADSRKDEIGGQPESFINHPLMRSGLLFSGAKFVFQENGSTHADNDGVLTAMEAIGLSLDQTQLVVLSACETGLGVISNGEGVYGLQRAFQLAGVKAVLMSLWTVPDQATQELMTNFYSKWMEGGDMRRAFIQAQSDLKKEHPNPHDWGGFVLIGN